MSIRTVLIAIFAAVFVLPAFANDPAMSTNNGGGTQMNGGSQNNPGRVRWTRKRIKHLRQRIDDYKKAERASDNLGYATGEWVPQMHRNQAERRQYLINRYEFLALKAERGRATAKDIAEMRALQNSLLGSR
jgi:Ni/Co efflux regulator RcnB